MAVRANVSLLAVGALIRYYRMLKGISQFSLCRAIGWEDPTRLSRLESGQGTKPSREVLDRIIGALELEWDERGNLLMAGGYLPEEDEVQRALAIAKKTWESLPHPSYLADYVGRVIDGNELAIALFDIDPKALQVLRRARPHILELIFNPEYGIQRHLKVNGWDEYVAQEVAYFKMEHRTKTHEQWYQELVRNLYKFDDFRRTWTTVTAAYRVREYLFHIDFSVERRPGDISTRMNFYAFMTPLAIDPRFQLVRHIPRDDRTHALLSELRSEVENRRMAAASPVERSPYATSAAVTRMVKRKR